MLLELFVVVDCHVFCREVIVNSSPSFEKARGSKMEQS